jgi:heme/copper-type cytochrome/quinol oxidase subunit 2
MRGALAPWTTFRRLAFPLGLLALTLAVLAAPAEASVLGPRPGHSPNADDIRTAYWVAIIVAALAIVVIHVFLGAALLRFRADRGRAPRRLAAGPGAFLRPAVPLVVIAAGLFVFGIVISSDARDVEPSTEEALGASSDLVAQTGALSVPADAKPLEINVVGQRWLWRFDYPQAIDQPPFDTFSYNQLVVPAGRTVILHVTSTDVAHRWFVPALGGQVDAIPGHVTDTWFRADREGTYRGQSTFYSGTSYAAMRSWVTVVSPERYRRFVRQKRLQIAASQDVVQGAVQRGTGEGATP